MSHIGFFRFLEALGKGCPICQIIREDTINSMDALLYEHVNDPVIRKQLRTRWLCNRHAWQLRSRGDAFGQSIIYEDLLENLVSLVEKAGKKDRKKGLNRSWEVQRLGECCMFCIKEKETEERLISDHPAHR